MKSTVIGFLSVLLVVVVLFISLGVFKGANTVQPGKISYGKPSFGMTLNGKSVGADKIIRAESYYSPIDRVYSNTQKSANTYGFNSNSGAAKSVSILSGGNNNSTLSGTKMSTVNGGNTSGNIVSSHSTSSASTSFSAQIVSGSFDSYNPTTADEQAMTRATRDDNLTDAPVGSILWLLLLLMPYAIYKFRY